jgi:hypothetical protein
VAGAVVIGEGELPKVDAMTTPNAEYGRVCE